MRLAYGAVEPGRFSHQNQIAIYRPDEDELTAVQFLYRRTLTRAVDEQRAPLD